MDGIQSVNIPEAEPPRSIIIELAELINEHTTYCQNEYSPYKLQHLTTEQALQFMQEMQQSLTHFAMWLDTVKIREIRNV